jgi:hypothetical protein
VSAIAHRAAMLPLADSRDGTVYLVLDPLRVGAFNTADSRARDVTAEFAQRVLTCAASWTMNCQLQCATSWSERVRECRRVLAAASKKLAVHAAVSVMIHPLCAMESPYP